MKIGFSALVVLVNVVATVAVDSSIPQWFTECLGMTNDEYRQTVAVAINAPDAVVQLQYLLNEEPLDVGRARLARILLARIHHPKVFHDFEKQIEEWRTVEKSPRPRGTRRGQLSGRLLVFTRIGPESRFIEEYVRDNDGNVVQEPYPSEREGGLKAIKSVRRTVERYTEAEVKAGIARNAAARQAVLEHFLKFLDEGDAYEQSEMVELVCRLWGRDRIKRTSDLAVIDNVPDADALIEAVLKDGSRPEAARMRAACCLPDSKRLEVRTFMMSVVTNNPVSHRQSHDVVGKALAYLESSADASDLAVLQSQTNAPSWKRDQIMKTSRSIESRLSAATDEK